MYRPDLPLCLPWDAACGSPRRIHTHCHEGCRWLERDDNNNCFLAGRLQLAEHTICHDGHRHSGPGLNPHSFHRRRNQHQNRCQEKFHIVFIERWEPARQSWRLVRSFSNISCWTMMAGDQTFCLISFFSKHFVLKHSSGGRWLWWISSSSLTSQSIWSHSRCHAQCNDSKRKSYS